MSSAGEHGLQMGSKRRAMHDESVDMADRDSFAHVNFCFRISGLAGQLPVTQTPLDTPHHPS